MPSADDLIKEARKSLGTGESPANTNYITRWYGMNGQPWCDMSVTYWAHHSGNAAAVCPNGPYTSSHKYAYTVWHAGAFNRIGQWHYGTKGIGKGDVIFYDWSGKQSISAIDHVGIVEHVTNGVIHTIEGNRGNRCARFIASPSLVAGYGRPKYTKAATATEKAEDMPTAISLQATGQKVTKGKATWVWWNKENDDSGKQHANGTYPGILTSAKFAMLNYCVHGVPGTFYAVAHNMKTKKDRMLGTGEQKSGAVDFALGAIYSNEHVYVKFVPEESGTMKAWVRGGFWK